DTAVGLPAGAARAGVGHGDAGDRTLRDVTVRGGVEREVAQLAALTAGRDADDQRPLGVVQVHGDLRSDAGGVAVVVDRDRDRLALGELVVVVIVEHGLDLLLGGDDEAVGVGDGAGHDGPVRGGVGAREPVAVVLVRSGDVR